MINLNCKYAGAWNFMCFGPEGIELFLEKMGNILVVMGENWHDINPVTGKPGSNGTGKCFARSTKILMFDGSVKFVEDIVVGDLVMGDDSTPRRVLSTHSGFDDMYEILPTKGDPYMVNSQHTLCLRSRDKKYDRYKESNRTIDIDVCDYLDKSKTWKQLHGGFRSKVDFPTRTVHLDPYFLGLWLGDGTTGKADISTADVEISEFVSEFAASHGLIVRRYAKEETECETLSITKSARTTISLASILALKLRREGKTFADIARHLTLLLGGNHPSAIRGSTVRRWCNSASKLIANGKASFDDVKEGNQIVRDSRLNPIKELLRSCGVLNNKHVPLFYKANDRATRLQILAGLIDTDGSPNGKGYDFISKIENLADDVCFLVRSLGMAAYKKQCVKKDQHGTEGIYFRVSISGDCHLIPVRIARKKVEKRLINKDVLSVGIKIAHAGFGEYFGFETDGNHRFLLADFTVVHNSCLQDIFSYAWYGRITREKTTAGDLIHKDLKKKMKVEVIWDKYRIVRTRKPESLRLWESADGIWDDASEITCGAGMVETQKKIESILGMNYKSFVGVTVFDDRNDHAFLEMDGPTKRIVVENLLSLEKYREYNKVAKSVRLEADKSIKSISAEYERSMMELDYAKKRVGQVTEQQRSWKSAQQGKVDLLKLQLSQQQSLMQSTDTGSAMMFYTAAQDRIAELQTLIVSDTDNRSKISVMVEDAKGKRDLIRQEILDLSLEKSRNNSHIHEYEASNMILSDEIKSLESLTPGVLCERCFGIVDPANSDHVIEQTRNDIESQKLVIEQLKLQVADKESEIAALTTKAGKMDDMISMAMSKDREILNRITTYRTEMTNMEKVPKPELDKSLALVEQRIADLRTQIETREIELSGPSPYDQIIIDAIDEVSDKSRMVEAKREVITEAEKLLPYFKFWVDAFGDDGIRRFVIDGIIPALNAQVAYWLDILIYGNLKLSFDNMLEPTIERVPFDGDPFVYSIMSGGERRRMHLSVIHAFAHIQMLNCGACPSILFLDEVVTNIDTNGKQAAFEMIQELAATRQVFLTTHDPELLDLLQGCQTVNLERRNGITKMVKKAV